MTMEMGTAATEVLGVATAALLAAQRRGRWPALPSLTTILDELVAEYPGAGKPCPLADAAKAFSLDAAETAALAIAAAVELDARFGALLSLLQGTPDALRPSVATLADICSRDGLSLLGPDRRLRRFALIELDGAVPLPFRYAACPAPVWLRLSGAAPRPRRPTLSSDELDLPPALRQAIADLGAWLRHRERAGFIIIWGPEGAGRHALATAIAHAAGRVVVAAAASALTDRERCVELEREVRWDGAVAMITSELTPPAPAVMDWLESAQVPRIWIQSGVPDWAGQTTQPIRTLEMHRLDSARRAAVWRRLLPDHDRLDSEELALRYRFGPGRIQRAIEMAGADGDRISNSSLAAATRATTRPGIAALAERLTPRPRSELILSPSVQREFDLAIGWATAHARLYRAWNLESTVARARGVTCLFAGPPGTGKTMAAQILAGEIDREVFRVDLSQAVSKWLGETEKNLSRVFDEAQDSGSVLFFDEADALFARRTQVRDSHDRYANLETGYLLQRLESHDGVVVLASNRREDLDSAFLRRFDVVVEFSLPGAAERERLWRGHLPAERQVVGSDDLTAIAAKFELSGGQIRNAVLTAIAMQALGGAPESTLSASALVRSAARELHRAGRLVNPAEYGDWASEVRAALPGSREG